MAGLPYAQMLDWTKAWTAKLGLDYASTAKGHSLWSGRGFTIGLQSGSYPDGTALTALVLVRKQVVDPPPMNAASR